MLPTTVLVGCGRQMRLGQVSNTNVFDPSIGQLSRDYIDLIRPHSVLKRLTLEMMLLSKVAKPVDGLVLKNPSLRPYAR